MPIVDVRCWYLSRSFLLLLFMFLDFSIHEVTLTHSVIAIVHFEVEVPSNMSGRQQRQAAASAPPTDKTPDLFHMLLPNAHTHIPKGAASMWERHYQQQQQSQQPQMKPLSVTKPTTPTRPHSSTDTPSRLHQSPFSPRQLHVTSPQKAAPLVKALTPRCKSADLSSPRQKHAETRPTASARSTRDSWCPRPAEYQREDYGHFSARQEARYDDDKAEEAVDQLPLNPNTREHVEMKACLLAYKHRIDVDQIHRVREKTTRAIEDVKAKQIVARGGILDDGSLFEMTKRKTSFLLRHFFALGDPDANTKQDGVLYDVIDEWSCREPVSADEIASLWKSILAHIEHSYVLRRQLVPKSDPDAISITIALDCLRKLPAKLPDYRRLLDVIISLIETGIYSVHNPLLDSDPQQEDGEEVTESTSNRGRRFCFQECQALREALDKEAEARRARLAADAEDIAARAQSPLQQMQKLLDGLDAAVLAGTCLRADKKKLLVAFLRSNLSELVEAALQESLQFCFDTEKPRDHHKRAFYNLWMPLLQADDALHVLEMLTRHHLPVFQGFFHENFDAMDKLLMERLPATSSTPLPSSNTLPSSSSPGTSSIPAGTGTLFQQLIERHPSEFASVLWASPYLTAHVFQDSHHLIARILEQNIVLISHVLQQRADVLLSLLNHTLRDNATAMEEFLMNHPKAFCDLLLSRGPAVAAAVKAYPAILVDILQESRPTLAKVLLSMPELLCHMFKSTPELLAQTIREDLTILPLAFSVVPQSLSDALERHPEYFVDIAHRKPGLVTKMFAKYPDLLLEPLEANPSVFSNFLVFHRKILPDFSDPNFDPTVFHFERKQFVDSAQQTEKRLCKYDGKLRLRERIKFQEDEQLYAMNQTSAVISATAAAAASNGRGTPGPGAAPGAVSSSTGRGTPVLGGERAARDSKATGALHAPSPGQVVSEIARLYVKKIESNAQIDAAGKKRRVLADFVLDLYIQELGFKRKAQKKLTLLLTGAQIAEQESLRIKWFLKFMNASGVGSSITSAVSTMDTPEVSWIYHPLAPDFYLSAAQFLVAQSSDQLLQRLDEELLRPCLVGYTRVKQFLEDQIMVRMLPAKDKRQQLLAAICEKENVIHNAAAGATSVSSSGASSSASSGRQTATATPTIAMLHLEDVLESLMLVWIHYQSTIRSEWTMQFQLANPDGSGVIRYSVFADLVRTKFPAMDDRAVMKIYHQCGEENDLGDFLLVVDDFSLAMSILQEQETLRAHSSASAILK